MINGKQHGIDFFCYDGNGRDSSAKLSFEHKCLHQYASRQVEKKQQQKVNIIYQCKTKDTTQKFKRKNPNENIIKMQCKTNSINAWCDEKLPAAIYQHVSLSLCWWCVCASVNFTLWNVAQALDSFNYANLIQNRLAWNKLVNVCLCWVVFTKVTPCFEMEKCINIKLIETNQREMSRNSHTQPFHCIAKWKE